MLYQVALHTMQLTGSSNKKDLTTQYHKLARIHHPDKGGSTNAFQLLGTAYQALMESNATANTHDEFGTYWFSSQADGGYMSYEDSSSENESDDDDYSWIN